MLWGDREKLCPFGLPFSVLNTCSQMLPFVASNWQLNYMKWTKPLGHSAFACSSKWYAH